jgi:uncharacterized repeat protein (TIGR02543 family)
MTSAKSMHRVSGEAIFRSFVALILCVGLMIPTNLTTATSAYAASDSATSATDAHRHGTVSITSDNATDNVITLKVGETADVTVAPYVHKQYQGCGMANHCPTNCESESANGDCFVTGFGCKCNATAFDRTAKVTSTVADASVVSASDVVAGEWINGDNANLKDKDKPVTKNGTVTLTGNAVGTTTVTVAAATDEDGSINATGDSSSELLEFWRPATATYTVNVVAADQDNSGIATGDEVQPSIEGLESDHDYASNTDKTYTYTWAAASAYGMAVTFDEQTETESGYDFITIADGEGNQIGRYSGSELAGKTVYVPQSGAFSIRLTSDSSTNAWGFKVAKVERLAANDLSLAGSIGAISAQFLSGGKAEPAPVVTYGAKTLSAGADYDVSYASNDAVGKATVTVTGKGAYTGSVSRTFDVVDADHLAAGAAVSEGQQKLLRQSGDTGSVSVSLSGATDEWAAAVVSVEVAPIASDGTVGEATVLRADQYSVSASGSVSFTRTESEPVFSVAIGEGDPVEVKSRWGSTTYPQSKKYQVTVKAAGYETASAPVTFYTGSSDEFKIIVDADGDPKTTGDQTVAATFSKDDIESMSTFQNASSQCGMTGFRTFSAKGVALSDLFEKAGVSVSATDSFKFDTTDNFGKTFTYDEIFGQRYFMQSIYDDQEVKDTYAKLVASDDQAGATVALRRLLAEKAVEDGSIAKPMISSAYAETLISGDEVASAVLPTESNTHISSLVAAENQYRFTYGISLVQEEHTVTFDAGDGVEAPAAQTVKSHLMTSTENTTIRTTYWNNAIVVYRNAAEPAGESTASDAVAEPEAPTREGYTFDGWYTKDGSSDGDWGEKYDFSAADRAVDADTTLHAKWTPITTQVVYRMYNPITSEHLFTTDASEYDSLVAHDWQKEGEAWSSPTTGKGVYRLYNAALGALGKMSHHYTTNKEEADDLVENHGWVYDNDKKPIFYSAEDESGAFEGAAPVYRLYNGGLSAHHYTMDKSEKDDLVKNNGWTAEGEGGIGFYAMAIKGESVK